MPTTPTKTDRTDLAAFLRMMDVASSLRQQREEVNHQLDMGGVREDIKKRLQATAHVTGEQLADQEIESAIDSYFSGLYTFKEPQKGLNLTLAHLYVRRAEIGKKV